MKKLAILTTHPIQYYAPVFKILQQRGIISIKVFYSWGSGSEEKYDPGFKKNIKWDLPLMDGYDYEWATNTAKDPGSHHFWGIVNPDLPKQISDWAPDALLVFGWAYYSHLRAILHFSKIMPVYFRGDSTTLDELPSWKAKMKSFFLHWLYKKITHAFYTGTQNKLYYLKYGLLEKQLSFAPHAVDNERFASISPMEGTLLRIALNIPADDTVVLFAGKLEEKKSPHKLLKAFMMLNVPGTQLIFTGNGQMEDSLRIAAKEWRNIHFMGFRNQSAMPAVYMCCDLFCLPSDGPGESWGLAVNEAMACSKAVLVSEKVGCAVDLVKSGFNGEIFSIASIDDLCSKLYTLLTGNLLLSKYGKNSGNKIKDWNFINIALAIEKQILYETQRPH